MSDWATIAVQLLMASTVFIFVAFVYRRLPGILETWLSAKQRILQMQADERERERQWQTKRDNDDYAARHNDRNILMVGQSELVQQLNAAHESAISQVMTGFEKALKILSENVCRYTGCHDDGLPRDKIRGETGGKSG